MAQVHSEVAAGCGSTKAADPPSSSPIGRIPLMACGLVCLLTSKIPSTFFQFFFLNCNRWKGDDLVVAVAVPKAIAIGSSQSHALGTCVMALLCPAYSTLGSTGLRSLADGAGNTDRLRLLRPEIYIFTIAQPSHIRLNTAMISPKLPLRSSFSFKLICLPRKIILP
jgi:hypothetical protein